MADAQVDFRILVGFPRHRKTKRMVRLLGHQSVLAWLRFLAFVRQMRPDGVLNNMTVEDIADEAEWTDTPAQQYVDILCKEVRFLDCRDDGVYVVHDWSEHNPFAFGQKARSDAARRAGEASGRARRKSKQTNDDVNGSLKSVQQNRTKGSTESNGASTGRSDALNPDSVSVSDSVSISDSVSDVRAHVPSKETTNGVDKSVDKPEKPTPIPWARAIRSLDEYLKSKEGRAEVVAMARQAVNDWEYSGIGNGDTSTWIRFCLDELREYIRLNPEKFVKLNWRPYLEKWFTHRVDKHRKYSGVQT